MFNLALNPPFCEANVSGSCFIFSVYFKVISILLLDIYNWIEYCILIFYCAWFSFAHALTSICIIRKIVSDNNDIKKLSALSGNFQKLFDFLINLTVP
jgi:hypothetical protein